MNRCTTTLFLALVTAACGSHPVAPSTTATPTAPTASLNVTLRGVVYDTAFRVVAGARVEIVEGSLAGQSTTTNNDGAFEFSGAFVGLVMLRATKEGYAAATQSQTLIQPGSPTYSFRLTLEPLTPPVNIAGDYFLTFAADSACTALPEEARTRTYDARISPLSRNTLFLSTVGGASFLGGYNSFVIGVAGDYVSFSVSFDGPSIVEQLAERTYLAITGSGEGSVGASKVSTIAVPFDGSIDYCVLNTESGPHYRGCGPIPSQTVTHAWCVSKNHRLTLTRR